MPQDSSDTKQRYVFDPRSSWTWLVVTNIKGWETIPSKWVANDHIADLYGYVAAEATSDPVPAVISIFLQRGYRRITDTLKRQFEATYDIDVKCEKNDAERHLFEKVLAGHADIDRYMNELMSIQKANALAAAKRQGKTKQDVDESSSDETNDSETCELQGALSLAALDGMADGNRKEFEKEKQKLNEKPVRRKEQQLRRKLRGRATIGNESEKICGPASVVAPTSVLVDRPRRRASTNLAWARPYVPGTEESGVVLPLDVTRSVLECPPGERFVWVARYTGPEQASTLP